MELLLILKTLLNNKNSVMKTLKMICCFFLLFFVSCSDSENSEELSPLVREWELVKRVRLTPPGANFDNIDITELCTLQISSDNTLVYNDPLLDYFLTGSMSYDSESTEGYDIYDMDFGNSLI